MDLTSPRQWSVRGEGAYELEVDGVEHRIELLEAHESGRLDLIIDGARVVCEVGPGERSDSLVVGSAGWSRRVAEAPPARPGRAAGARDTGLVTPPFPATVIAIRVNEGDAVERGQTLVVISAMKMEMNLTAPKDGVVESIETETGATVAPGDELIIVKSRETDDGEGD